MKLLYKKQKNNKVKYYFLGIRTFSKKIKEKKMAEKEFNSFIDQKPSRSLSSFLTVLKDSRKALVAMNKKGVEQTHIYLPFLFKNTELSYVNTIEDEYLIDSVYFWGMKPLDANLISAYYCKKNKASKLILEDGFLRSATTWVDRSVDARYTSDLSFTIDDMTCYYDATQESRLEQMLNDKTLIITEEQKQRARRCIDKIVDTHLTKYNHQPIYSPSIGREGAKKVLVIDQSYGDLSIPKGLADDKTFEDMLQAAIDDNPDADIIVKIHPDALAQKHLDKKLGYYTEVEQKDNVYLLAEPVNPISLLKYVDKVYVCTTQFGFEALMCGKEVHVFGMPFYANWGLTNDRQACKRRKNKRSLEEVFYISYILYSFYVSPKTQKLCEIEDVMEYLLELREEYFDKFGVRNELSKN